MNSSFFLKNASRYFFLTFFFVLFCITHLFNLGSVPKGLHADEASFLLNAYSIANTGKDEDDRAYPIWFSSLIDSKPALYSYLQIPFVRMLGPTTTASRIPGAIFGFVSIFLAYWALTFLLKKKHALLVSLFLIISPWHIMVARSTQEVILAFVFSLLAIGAYFSVLKSNKNKILWSILFITATVLAMYSYHSAKVFLPLLFMSWSTLEIFIFDRNDSKKELTADEKRRKKLLHLGLNIGILVAGVIITLSFPQSVERFKAVGFLTEKGPILIMEEQIRTATTVTPSIVIRVFYNKVVAHIFRIIDVYARHFTFEFIFIKGGEPDRYQVPFHGLFYYIEIFLLPLGIFTGLHSVKHRRWAAYTFLWFLIAPLPAALTTAEVPSMIRTFPMVLPALVFISYALLWIWEKRTHPFAKVALLGILAGYVWGFSYFSHQLFVQQARYHPWKRNVAEEKLAIYLKEHASEYDRVHITTLRDLYMYLVLADPTLLPLLQNSEQTQRSDEFLLGKYFFHEGDCAVPIYPPEKKVLYVVRSNCPMNPGFNFVTRIKYDDAAEVYDLFFYAPPTVTLDS